MGRIIRGIEAEQLGYRTAADTLAGEELPARAPSDDQVDIDDFMAGVRRHREDLTRRLMNIPAKVSEDPKVQAIVREELLRVMAEAEVRIADTMFNLKTR